VPTRPGRIERGALRLRARQARERRAIEAAYLSDPDRVCDQLLPFQPRS
jgi:hypothetical protein